MRSAEMQCIVCEAAPRAGVLFLCVLEELCGDLLQASVSLIGEHAPQSICRMGKASQKAFSRGF